MEDVYTSGKNQIAPARDTFAHLTSFLDDAVRKKLDEGIEVINISPQAKSLWGCSAKLDTLHPDGRRVPYFLKVHVGPGKEGLMASEYHAMTIMHEAVPELAARPIAYSCYSSDKDVWFLLYEFRKLRNVIPEELDIEEFCDQIVLLQQSAVNPEGQFGWPWPVYAGKNSRVFPLSESWEETFTRGLLATFELEERMQGPDEELTRYRDVLFEKIIPRLIRPLQADGRSIQPTLIHGNLWHGNVAEDAKTGKPIIFDPCPMWAHHELELGPWACPRHRIGPQYIEVYRHRHRSLISAPVDDFENRMLLYSLNFDVQSSSNYPGNHTRREIFRNTLRQLIDRCSLEDGIMSRAKKLLMQGLGTHDKKDVEEDNDDDDQSAVSMASTVAFNEISSVEEAVDGQLAER